MPPSKAPQPQSFPCQIGSDFWQRQTPKTKKWTKVPYTYSDVKCDIDGWADCNLWLPHPYDLCWLKTPTKTRTGWWTGRYWEGMRISPKDQILYWKKSNDD